MRYFRPCPYCGANLDPGERCECMDKEERMDRLFASIFQEEENGQMALLRETVLPHGYIKT